MEDDSHSREERLERGKDFIIIFLSGVATLLGIVLAAFVFSIVLDRWCCCFMSPMAIMTEEELNERRRASPLVRRSSLAGMLPGERTKTLRQFFGKIAYAYQKEKVEEGEDETTGSSSKERKKAAKQQKKSILENGETVLKSEEWDVEKGLESKKDETDSSEPTMKSAEIKEEANDNGEEEDKELQGLVEMDHTDGTCSICLNDYENGDKVMTGTSCSHLFHYDCIMQWLEKDHDHCAYCRKDMLSSKEYVEAAREALGDARVDRLIMINEEYARVNGTNDTIIANNTALTFILLVQPTQETEPDVETLTTVAISLAEISPTLDSEEPSLSSNDAPSVASESVALSSGSHLEVFLEATTYPVIAIAIEAPEDKEDGSPVDTDAAEASSETAQEIKVVQGNNEDRTKESSTEDVASEKEDQVDIESGSNNDESPNAEVFQKI